jgi:SagB-type dehydrogenase family enzyme
VSLPTFEHSDSSNTGGEPVAWPQEILDRLQRIYDYHQSTKLSSAVYHQRTPPDLINEPSVFLSFPDAPAIPRPKDLLSPGAGAFALLREGRKALPDTFIDPPRDLRTLASWLFLANGLTHQQRVGARLNWRRTLSSLGGTYPSEIYVAAFAVDGLEPGLYHYSPRELVLRRLRKGLDVLAALKRGRPDLQFLRSIPAALLVSTVFARSSWAFGERGYRAALIDAGRQIEQVVQSGSALGISVAARLMMNDSLTRELIGVAPDAPYEHAEVVQALVAWADPLPRPLDPPSFGHVPMPPIARPDSPRRVIAYEAIRRVHHDCVAPGVALREIHPPITTWSPIAPDLPAEQREPVVEPEAGTPFGQLVTNRRAVATIQRRTIPRDQFLAINRAAMRGPAYYPMMPDYDHASLVKPVWMVLDVAGIDRGIWYYDAPADRWTMLMRGNVRLETAFLSCELSLAGDAAAVCVLVANLEPLLLAAGPDAYRLAHLEAGIIAHRIQLGAEALGLAASSNVQFFDDELREFLELQAGSWEVIQQVLLGAPLDENSPRVPEVLEQLKHIDPDAPDWRG